MSIDVKTSELGTHFINVEIFAIVRLFWTNK